MSGLSGETTREKSWRELAWNGIAFEMPAGWQIGIIEPRYLLLEHARTGKPVVEMKWNRIRGRFSPRKTLRRLAAGQQPLARKSLRIEPVPASWSVVLAGRPHAGFIWRTPRGSGRGVLVFCPQCATAALIQFLGPDPDSDIALRFLKSFRDHFSRNEIPLAVYDIAALIPAGFQLNSHRFESGRFELGYTGPGRRRLRLLRWAPASLLLAGCSLTDFFAAQVQVEPHRIRETVDRSLEARPASMPSAPLRWLQRIRRRPAHYRARLWHLPEFNRILAVRLEGSRPIETEFFEWICRHYALV